MEFAAVPDVAMKSQGANLAAWGEVSVMYDVE